MLLKCLPLILIPCVLGFSKKIRIGGLFDDVAIQRSFETSVKTVNEERRSNPEFSNTYLEIESKEVGIDVFEVSENVCVLLEMGVAAIFGPQSKFTSEHVQSICDAVEMPHIYGKSEPQQARGKGINMFPRAETLSIIFNQIVTDFQWKLFAILYEDSDSFVRIHTLLERKNAKEHTIFLFDLGHGPNYRQSMKEIKLAGITNIIIDCSINILPDVLTQALQVGIMSDRNRIIVTSLDLQTIDLEPYQYSGVNFTGVRLIDPENPLVTNAFQMRNNEWGLNQPSDLRVEPALMYDAVQLFARALKHLKDAVKGDVKQLFCNGSMSWEHGYSLSNFMRLSEMEGLTGLIKFDTAGFRSDFHLDVIRVTEEGLKKIGMWNSTNTVEWLPERHATSTGDMSLQNRTFIVLISNTAPYGMLKESAEQMSGNERYEGFAIDIIQELSKALGFNYTFEMENVYGSKGKDGKWSGMIGKIMADQADLAITDLTITAQREEAVDFTTPFMNLGISILYKKPTVTPPSLFSFLSPFSSGVWLYVIAAYVFFSLLLFIVARLCPAEWTNPYPCIEEPEELENQFTFKNSFWFTIGAIMQQGADQAPIGTSTRMMGASWAFFTLIMVSSYTANLAAFLTVEAKIPAFNNVEELAKKTGEIKYGAKSPGATFDFFKESNFTVYKQMYKYMMDNAKDVLPTDNVAGVKKVSNENYAFLMESTSIEYVTERNCNVTRVGDLLDTKGYGIAMKKESPYRHGLDNAILKLQQSGKMQELQNKWWKQKRGGGACADDDAAPTEGKALGLENVGGVFLVLTVGAVASFFFTLYEFLWDVGCTSVRENVSFKEEMIAEMKFLFKCSNSEKPVRRRKGSSSRSNRSGGGSTRGCTPPYGLVPAIKTSNSDDK